MVCFSGSKVSLATVLGESSPFFVKLPDLCEARPIFVMLRIHAFLLDYINVSVGSPRYFSWLQYLFMFFMPRLYPMSHVFVGYIPILAPNSQCLNLCFEGPVDSLSTPKIYRKLIFTKQERERHIDNGTSLCPSSIIVSCILQCFQQHSSSIL